MMRRLLGLFAFVLIGGLTSMTCLAQEIGDDSILLEYGYTQETMDALPESTKELIAGMLRESPEKVSISSVTMEVDFLTEIEALFSCSEEKISTMGLDIEYVMQERERILKYCDLTDVELAEQLGIDEQEAKLVKKAILKGIKNANADLEEVQKVGVRSSGYLSSSEIYYVQTVTDQSNTIVPSHKVILSYSWTNANIRTGFRDKIVAAWGGGLNIRNISSVARYYDWTTAGADFGSYCTEQSMTPSIQPQEGVIFDFPQFITAYDAQNKTGHAQFELYQTVGEGKETTLISHYCFKTFAIGDSIEITYPISIEIGAAYKPTEQRYSVIRY